MRRWISSMLTFIMAFSLVAGEVAPVAAEEVEEVVSECFESEIPLAEDTGAEELVVELGEIEIEESDEAPAESAAVQEAPAPAGCYARLTAPAELAEAPDGIAVARLEAGSVVLVPGDARNGQRAVAFNTGRGVVCGYVDAAALSDMTAGEAEAFVDALIATGAVALYNDSLDMPLPEIACAFIEQEAAPAGEAAAPAEEAAAPAGEAAAPAEATEAPAETAGAPVETEASLDEAVANEAFSAEPASETPAEEAPGYEANVSNIFDISERTAEVVVGDTHVIEAVTNNGEAIEGGELSFASSDAEVAAVDENGVVTALKAGSADITVTYHGEALKSIINVPREPDSIQLNTEAGVIGRAESCALLSVEMLPQGSAASVTWSSSDSKTVTVDENGVVRGVRKGSATITAATRNGKTASCKVTVKNAPSKVTTAKKLTLGVDQAQTLTAKLPSGSASGEIQWSSADESIARVDENGNVTGVAEGQVKITARTYNDKTAACSVTVKPAPTGITLNSEALSMIVSGTATLKAELTPAGAMEANRFESSDESVATVNADGKVTAKKLGTATITVTTYSGVKAQCEVKVLAAPNRVALNQTAVTLGVGAQYELAANVQPVGADPTVTWKSSNGKVAKVSGGTVTTLKTGTATITARTANGKKATCKITVKAAPTGIAMKPTALKLAAGGMTFQLTGSVRPRGAEPGITFTSSNTGVATVSSSGLITTGEAGSAVITATTYNGKTARCSLTVTARPARASFAQTSVIIAPRQSYTPEVDVLDASGAEAIATLTFEATGNAGVIRVDSATGKITGVKAGTATVNVVTHNNVSAAVPLTVKVMPVPTGVSLNATGGKLGVGESYTLAATLKGPSGCGSELTWKSSNAGIVSVTPGADGKCTVTGVKTGTATVTVATGNGKTAKCKITVKKAPTSVKLKVSSKKVAAGSTVDCTVTRSSGSVGAWVITSSDESVLAKSDVDTFTAKKAGTATLTVTTYNGKTHSIGITVTSGGSTGDDSGSGDAGLSDSDAAKIEKVVALALSKLGKPYIYGAGYRTRNPSGFDCSGLTYWCYYYGAGVTLGDSAYRQGNDSRFAKITALANLRRGDILCFKSDARSTISHVGLYLGGGKFVHASSSGGKVQYGYFNKGNSAGYWTRNLKWGYHVIGG